MSEHCIRSNTARGNMCNCFLSPILGSPTRVVFCKRSNEVKNFKAVGYSLCHREAPQKERYHL